MSPLQHALLVLAVYLIPFFALGWLAKRWIGRWMDSRGVTRTAAWRASVNPIGEIPVWRRMARA